ncbi:MULTISPECIES: GAF domain-containing sensor histidine kinase [unclassified Ectothiorhodospira]|jgi:signal transduction histidine kinase|uniref:GAF domain-containing sensor histidine kinase n=1 Tax=unclassified Ectothiorhodospira TaxID=2684909 RepID=UPI001EE7C3C0|nr:MULTISPECIES: GAF domain-containing sensor histidine kinase [unclassified Ectothiorhodospira]MCG5517156.1 GAF domain-containing sensor histidine kinase [Ectothiorhodospira sp. 9100]MCG5520051.1 GAF domain-containing sensor histidine kinase [Ectothiorhodospira sp. 9905]
MEQKAVEPKARIEELEYLLSLARGSNQIAGEVLETSDRDYLLQRLAMIMGRNLGCDRALIYDIRMDAKLVVGLCEWLSDGEGSVTPTRDTYPLESFEGGIRHIWESRGHLESHSDGIHASFMGDGSAQLLHGKMQIQSLLWYPFAFREDGFYLLVFNQTRYPRCWSPAELEFCESATHQVALALQKMELIEQQRAAEACLRSEKERAYELAHQAESANRAKTQFLANTTHELLTPLNGIIGMVQVLMHTPLSHEQYADLNVIFECGYKLLDHIRTLLEFAELERGERELQSLLYDPADLLNQVRLSMISEAQEKGLTLMGEVDPDVPPRLWGDPEAVKQTLMILVDNAIKFTPTGRVTVMLKADDRWLRFLVEDTGIGIPLEQHPCLFERFTQVDCTDTRAYPGMGMGLAMAQLLVAHMGGEIGLSSCEARGSTFWFQIPRQAPVLSDEGLEGE